MISLEDAMKEWEPVIGLECHIELTSLDSKMFCSCKNEHGDAPNTNVCPVCLGMPGALPSPNKEAIKDIVLTGLATNCDIEKHTMFYRKGYMYPDMAKNFQITQGPKAFCMRGHLDLTIDAPAANERVDIPEAQGKDGSYTTHIGIHLIHLEEDAAKMVHVGGREGRIEGATHSIIDYNRAGTPLMELVTEPEMHTPEEARRFMEKLREIVLALGISDCSMENGSMRADGNVSLRRRGTEKLGTKTELKNINSFKNLHDGLAFEIRRQAEILNEGATVLQETRHYDPSTKHTIPMRTKETAADYRMFPDPDLAPFDLSDEFIDEVRAMLPELPDQKAERYQKDWGLSSYDARNLVKDPTITAFFEACMKQKDAQKLVKPLANLLINDVAQLGNEVEDFTLGEGPLTPERAVSLVGMVDAQDISTKQMYEVLKFIVDEDKDPATIVKEHGMKQVSDTSALGAVVDKVIADNPDKVAAYKGGKTGLLGFFMGQCMKALKGQGNPRALNELLRQKLQ